MGAKYPPPHFRYRSISSELSDFHQRSFFIVMDNLEKMATQTLCTDEKANFILDIKITNNSPCTLISLKYIIVSLPYILTLTFPRPNYQLMVLYMTDCYNAFS